MRWMVVLLCACTGAGEVVDDVVPTTHDGTLVLIDGMSAAPLRGGQVLQGDLSEYTGEDGSVAVSLAPGEITKVVVEAQNYLPVDVFLRGGEAGAGPWTIEVDLFSKTILESFAGAQDIPFDPRAGVLSVAVHDPDNDGDGLEGLVVGTTPPSDLALVDAPGSQFGFAPGSTLLRESTFVMFGNLPAGAVTVSFDAPAAETCTLAPGYTDGPGGVVLSTARRGHIEVACR